jgi:folate-dependent phosphoribosylglycinamide formyltransferase PurN
MKIVLLSRYPRVDTGRWKRDLVRRLHGDRHMIWLVYTDSSLADQALAGLREFGWGAGRRYRGAHSAGAEPQPTLSRFAAEAGVRVARFRRIGSADLLGHVRHVSPDLMILLGAAIVPTGLAGLPAAGTINPHFGLLPKYRGMNVAEWSIRNDDPVGVTVHFVDSGIDTGAIAAQRVIAVEQGDTLESIREKQRRVAVELLQETVRGISGGRVDRRPQRPEEGRQYYRMHPALRAETQRKLAEGRYALVECAPGQR